MFYGSINIVTNFISFFFSFVTAYYDNALYDLKIDLIEST